MCPAIRFDLGEDFSKQGILLLDPGNPEVERIKTDGDNRQYDEYHEVSQAVANASFCHNLSFPSKREIPAMAPGHAPSHRGFCGSPAYSPGVGELPRAGVRLLYSASDPTRGLRRWCGRKGRRLRRERQVRVIIPNANPFRGTPLLWGCYSDKVDAAIWLLDHGADPDLRHDWGGEGHGVDAVAMHLAAQHNCVRCLNLLLDRGADPTIADGSHGGTPAGWAEYGGASEALDILKRRGK